MRYLRSAVVPFLILTIILLASCGGGSHSNTVGPITSITLSPSPTISMNAGDFIQMSASATDARGNAVNNQTITFSSSSPSVAQVATNGLLCAGQWRDGSGNPSLTNPVVCFQPAIPPASNFGTSNITATAQGVTSNIVTVSVHPRVARVTLTPSQSTCTSQGGQIVYTAAAFDGATPPNDITSLVGNFTWSIADSTIGTLSTTSTAPANTVTALIPGLTTVTASVNITNPVTSPAVVFQECPVGSIVITGPDATMPNLAFMPSPANVGDPPGQVTATITDTIGGAVLTGVTLAWNTNQAAVATVSSSGLVTAAAPGTSNITASCALNTTCNKNQGTPVTSNIVTASVTGSSVTTVYATGTGTTSLVPIDTTTNTAGTAISLTDKPNSLVFDAAGNNAFLGSPSGLMVVSASSNTLTRTISNALGTVLAVSPNGQFVLLGGSGVPTVLYNNTANTVTTLNITNAVAADFSPDGSEIVVADATGVRVVGAVVRTVSATVAKDVSFLATGAMAYLAAPQAPSVIVCNNALNPGKPASGTPTLVKTLPNGSKMLGAELPSLAVIGVTVDATHCPTMPPTITETPVVLPFAGVGGTPKAGHITVTSNGTRAYISSDVAGKLLSYDAVGNTTGSVLLVGTTPVTFSATAPLDNGGATSDSAFVYVGVNDGGTGSVHVIDVNAGTDTVQIPTLDTGGANFVPDLVAVRPH